MLDRQFYDAVDLARSGAIISLDYGASPVVHFGYARPEDGDSDREADQGDNDDATSGNVSASLLTPAGPALLHYATLVEDLTAQRRAPFRLGLPTIITSRWQALCTP